MKQSTSRPMENNSSRIHNLESSKTKKRAASPIENKPSKKHVLRSSKTMKRSARPIDDNSSKKRFLRSSKKQVFIEKPFLWKSELEGVCLRFPQIGEEIFKELDNENIAKCRQISRKMFKHLIRCICKYI